MSNPIDPFDEISQDEIFQELRSFASTPVPEDPQILASLVQEFKSAQVVPTRKWFKRVIIPTVTIVIAVPSLAYAGLLPEGVSTDIKQIVHNVTTVVTKPIAAISNSITGNSSEPRLNSTPSGTPSSDASAVVNSPTPGNENGSDTAPATNEEQSQVDQGGQGEQNKEVQVSVVTPSPSNSPLAAQPTATKKSEKSSEDHKVTPTKKSESSSEDHKSPSSNPNSIASPSSSTGEHEDLQQKESEQENQAHSATPQPSRTGQSIERPQPSSSSTSRERESERSRVKSTSSPAPIVSPIARPSSGEHEDD